MRVDKESVGKRLLLESNLYGGVFEATILNISDNEKYIKIMKENGSSFWEETSLYQIADIISSSDIIPFKNN
jgi:hypothetical protein